MSDDANEKGGGLESAVGRVSIGRALRVLPAVIALTASVASAGYLLVDGEGERTLVSKGRVKEFSEYGAGGPQSVFDLGRARAWMSDPGRSVYWEGTIDELCTTMRETAAALSKAAHETMEEQLARLPPEQRKRVEELRKALAERRAAAERKERSKPGAIHIERTAETAVIAGQPTRLYRVLVDGELYQEDWLSTDASLAKEFALDKASALMSRVSACAGSSDAATAMGVDEGEIYRELYPHGWPLKAVSYRGGKAEPRTEIRKVEKRDVPDRQFEPPPGYRKATLGEVLFSATRSRPPAY